MHAAYWRYRVRIMEEGKLESLRSMIREVRANRTAGTAHHALEWCLLAVLPIPIPRESLPCFGLLLANCKFKQLHARS